MSYLANIFNSREIAIGIWTFIFLLWTLSFKSFRKSLSSLFKAFFVWQIIIPILLMFLYITLMVLIFWIAGLWKITNLKDTVIWGLGTAFVMLMNVKNTGDDHYFQKVILDNVKLILIVEFVVNFRTFNIWIELFIIPLLTIIVMLNSFVERDQKYKQIKKILEILVVYAGFCLLCFSFYNVVVDFSNFASLDNLVDFLLPPVFTILFLPFMYAAALYALYQSVFVRLRIFNNDNGLITYVKLKIFQKFLFNFRKLNRWAKGVGILKINSKQDIVDLLDKA